MIRVTRSSREYEQVLAGRSELPLMTDEVDEKLDHCAQ